MNIEALGITREEMREQIIERAAEKLADEAGSEESIFDRVGREVNKRLDAAVAAKLDAKIDALLNEQLERLLNETIQPVDIWGDKVGQPTTIKATLSAKAKEFWSGLVDSNGKAATDVTSWSRDRYKTRAEWMLGKVVADEFAGQVKQHIDGILTMLKDKLRADAVAMVDRHLNDT